MLGFQDYITFKEDTHQYFNPKKKEYTSASRVLDTVKNDFDAIGISGRMAPGRAKADGISVDEAQERILAEWKVTNKSAIDHGNWIHDNLEKYMLEGRCDDLIIPVAKRIAAFLSKYYKYFPEAIVYDSEYEVAGTADLPVQRQSNRTKVKIIDWWDYKTNESKGIVYDSIAREKDGEFKKHYNKFLKYPLDHLEDCNYNHYSLQLSLYALMAEKTFGVKTGRCGIIFINKRLQPKIIPVPYMKMEAIALLKHFKDSKKSGWED